MNHISPVNHPESALSGSTVESMIDRAKELGAKYFASTDQGMMLSSLKGYTHAKKKDIKFIAGIELFFKDKNCEIIKGTPSENIKYFKIIVHAKDQEAYQKMVKLSSDQTKETVVVGGNFYPLCTWKDLEALAKYNITICTSDIEGMVSKHLLVNTLPCAMKYYSKLRDLVGPENFYPTIIPAKQDKYWNTIVKVELDNGHVVEIPAQDRVEFVEIHKDSKEKPFKRAKAIDLTKWVNRTKKLTAVYLNKIRYPVKEEYQLIKKSEWSNDFQDLPGGDIQTKANNIMIKFAERYGDLDNLLINNYAYYANKDDKVVQDMKLGDEFRIYQSQYMASSQDICMYLHETLGISQFMIDKIIANSHKWAEKFDDFELNYDYSLPTPAGDPKKLLVEQINKVGRMDWNNKEYVTQFREEFELLTNNGVIDLIPYFLPIVDVYDFYRENGHLTGPARGSAGGFLISYLIGITHIDPIKYGLSSSRFLTIDRVQSGNLPDIDCDLESRVPLVGNDGNSGYLFNKYGNMAAQVSTRTLLRIKSAILDANRFVNNGAVEDEIQRFSKSLPNTPQGVNDHEYVFGYEKDDGSYVPGLLDKSEELQKYATERPEEWNIVKRALSISRNNSRHACAYVVADRPIEEIVPIMEVGGVNRVTQPDAKQCEWAGLIKYDFLVVAALRDINSTLKYINERNKDEGLETGHFMHEGVETYIWDLPEDQAVFKDLGDGKTESVFQLNTASVTPAVMKIKPESIIDCATITSLWRPGPLDFIDEKTGRNMAEEYIERRHGRSVGEIEILNEMLPETYGVLVFQEQVTKLAKELAGMNVIDSENVRIAVGKKKQKLIDSLKPIFIEGASKKCGVETATKIWSMMETFARYGFNKSHAVAYSVISYACSYLKHYYPLEWWAGVLSNADDKEINEVFYKYVKDLVLPPDINTSTEKMTVDYENGKIRNKLSMISGLGVSAAEKIISNRPYRNLEDFVKKKPCGPALTRKLIHVNVLDSLFGDHDMLIDKIDKYEAMLKKVEFDKKHEEYIDKCLNLEKSGDDKAYTKAMKAMDKFVEKGPKPHKIDPMYQTLSPKIDYLIKKSIFPTMNLDLQSILNRDSRTKVTQFGSTRKIMNKFGKENVVISGEGLQQIDNAILSNDAYFCVPAFVMDASEFSYKNGTKKALKMILDSSGYVSEKVLWPDFQSGELIYPESLKKGAIVYIFYGKKADSIWININDIIIEEDSILS